MPIKTSSDTTITRMYGKTKGKIQTQSKVPPIDFHAKTGLTVEYSMSGNMTQASTQEYSITDIPPIDFMSDGNSISAYSIYGNMVQATSQQYSLTGTSPLSFKSDANTLISWSMLGNGSQSDTPTPDNPVMPEFVGVRTENLAQSVEQGGITNVGEKTTTSIRIRVKADVFPNTTYTFASNKPISIISGFTGETYAHAIISPTGFPTQYTFTTGEDDTVVYVTLRNEDNTKIRPADLSGAMLNLGSTALPYEPYGYKIPFNNHGDNLWDEDYTGISGSIKYVPLHVGNGSFTLSTTAPLQGTSSSALFLLAGNVSSGATGGSKVYLGNPLTVNSINEYVTVAFRGLSTVNPADYNTMLNAGSTAKPYSPYFSETVPIYLGQTQTVRKVKKLVLTGTRADGNTAITAQDIIYITPVVILKNVSNGYCTHYKFVNQAQGSSMPLNSFTTSGGAGTSLWFKTEFDNVADFKSYLAAQYAAGTPVTVWYALAEPKTAIVNEPLAKIGNYADELHSTDTAVTIPTISGDNTLSIGTTLPPSSVSITTTSGVWTENPIILEEMGDLVESGEHAGQYTIPITNAGTTTNIYALEPLRKIGDYVDVVDSSGAVTRSIKKLVLDGTEVSWASETTYYTISISPNLGKSLEKAICSHAPYETGVAVNSDGTVLYFRKSDFSDYSDLTAFKAFLAQEYANGNPVTVWYVLATPTTETITSPTITTLSGTNALSIGTTLQPSNVSLTTSSSVYPLNPIIPEEVGDLVETGDHAGEYKIPLNLNNTISNIYLSQPIRKIGNYSDIVNSDGTVTRQIKEVDLGDLTWTKTGSGNFSSQLPVKGVIVSNSEVAPAICSDFKVVSANNYSSTPYSICGAVNAQSYVSVNKTDYEDLTPDQFKNAVTGIKYWYALSTPQTESITPPTITPSIESNTISVNTTLQPSNLSITYTSPDYSEIKLVYDNQGNILYNDPPYHDWGAVRWIVRQGLGPQYYPIGYIFYDNFNPETGTAFQVVAHNKHFDPNLTALGYTYSMTLCEVLLTDVIKFDEIEAFLYTNTVLPAGTYRFTIPNYDATCGGNKTYYFTSTSDLPAGSQIVMNWPYNQTPKTVTAYSPSGTTMVQNITTATSGWSSLILNEYIEGTSPTTTDLGTIAGPSTQLGTSDYGEMNHIHRARYGSNNYLQSGIRQYINSNSPANTWWEPQTIFDRPYTTRTSAGKLTKLNSNLVNVMAKPEIESRTNSYFETTSLDGTTFTLATDYSITSDKMFLLAPVEVGFSTTDTTVGTLLDYYVEATDETRIKKRKSNNSAYYWWLRTPYPSGAYGVRYVFSSGALNSYFAYISRGSAAACVIQ